MRKRHNTLNDTIFRNSKYMKVVNEQVGCKDFSKEYKKQYEFMLDTFSTLILINNAFFSDSNLSISDKVENALNVMEQYLYEDYNESEKAKYSVRTIQSIPEKHCTHLYREISNWYELFGTLTSNNLSNNYTLKNILNELEKEINRLSNLGFDDMVKENISYKKNKDSNYKLYLCAFDSLNVNSEELIEEYKKNFEETYGLFLSSAELEEICFIYTLIAKANNGIVKMLYDTTFKTYNITASSSPQEVYNTYLETLHINNNSFSKLEATYFVFTASLIYENVCKRFGVTFDEMISNFDFYFFIERIESIIKQNELSIHYDLINKLVKDLEQVYDKIIKSLENNNKKELVSAFQIITNVIDRNKKYFIRIS